MAGQVSSIACRTRLFDEITSGPFKIENTAASDCSFWVWSGALAVILIIRNLIALHCGLFIRFNVREHFTQMGCWVYCPILEFSYWVLNGVVYSVRKLSNFQELSFICWLISQKGGGKLALAIGPYLQTKPILTVISIGYNPLL